MSEKKHKIDKTWKEEKATSLDHPDLSSLDTTTNAGRIVNKKILRESEAYRNFGKRFDWSLAIKRHIVMAAPMVERISLVNGFKRHIVMAASFPHSVPLDRFRKLYLISGVS